MAARPKQGARAEPKESAKNERRKKPEPMPEPKPEPRKKQHNQRTEAEWRKIKLEYVAGKTTLKKLAEKWGVSESTITKKASTQCWKKRRKQVGKKLEEKTIERLCDARAREFETIAAVNDKMSDVLDNLVEFIVQQPPEKYDDLRGVESLTKAIAQVVMVKRDLYNVPTEAEKAKIEALREKAKLDREKWQDEIAEKAASKKAAEDTILRIRMDEGKESEELDG